MIRLPLLPLATSLPLEQHLPCLRQLLLLLLLQHGGEQPEAFRFEDPMFDSNYNMFKAYANSKLALLMFAEELQHRLNREKSNVIVNSANPGVYRASCLVVSSCVFRGRCLQ